MFRTIEPMRGITATAARERRRVRRDHARRAHLSAVAPPQHHEVPTASHETGAPARPFNEIEEW